ncbi:MAG: aspartate/glutamate racemase family protein [Janthinobacterium lividum]
MSAAPSIMLIHATPVAIDPIHEAFRLGWPAAALTNILDDGLSRDRALKHELDSNLTARFVELVIYAYRRGADGILVTCSAFGPAIEQAAQAVPIPVLKPNEAMFEAAMKAGENIGMLATFAPSVLTMEEEFSTQAAQRSSTARLQTQVVALAMDALRAGDEATHNRLVAAGAAAFDGCDALMLAHFSTSRAAVLVRKAVNVPVLTAPDAAVAALKQRIAEGGVS